MIYYVTEYRNKNGKLVRYKTQTLTQYHTTIREQKPEARTIKFDTSIDWPFGTFGEIIAPIKTKGKNL